MNRTKLLNGLCTHCDGALTYPAELIGTNAPCPHCGKMTELLLAEPEQESFVSRRIVLVCTAAVLLLLLSLGGTLLGLQWAKAKVAKQAAQVSSIELINLRVEKDADGVSVQGTLTNKADQTRLGIKLALNLLDVSGRKLATRTYYQASIPPKSEARIKLAVDTPNVAGAKLVSIQEDQRPP